VGSLPKKPASPGRLEKQRGACTTLESTLTNSKRTCDALERTRISPGVPRGRTGDDIRRLLAVLPDTPVGLRDRAIMLTLTFTGRRAARRFWASRPAM
jgi:site-specific recombinase XerC